MVAVVVVLVVVAVLVLMVTGAAAAVFVVIVAVAVVMLAVFLPHNCIQVMCKDNINYSRHFAFHHLKCIF